MDVDHTKIQTLGDLKESNWQSRSVKDEIRQNVIRKIRKGETLFPGILGYQKTVLPQFTNALLSRHDIILLGLRGQGKSKMLRMLINFLDPWIPVIKDSQINDNPLQPYSKHAKELIARHGDDTPVEWIHREDRYGEKLATPDTAVADLIGDIDPIKAASRKLSLSDEEVINFGLIPHVNRGIFAINELPDLQPRIQVALLNIMQERDIQIRGFNIRFPIDVLIVFSANPEDYTNRGNIITPLKDRIDSQIITHYPKTTAVGRKITNQEAWVEREQITIHVPEFARDIIEQVAIEARSSEYIDQKSGVSTRLTITAMEQLLSSVEQRAFLNNEEENSVRITDIFNIVPALTGKLELVYEGEQEGAINVAKHLIGKAIDKEFSRYFPDPQEQKIANEGEQEENYETVINWFANGKKLVLSDTMKTEEYRSELDKVNGLQKLTREYMEVDNESDLYAAMDFVIEALHQNSMLGKDDSDEGQSYTDMVGSMLGSLDDLDEFDDDDFR